MHSSYLYDPYEEVEPQEEEAKKYSYGIGNTGSLVFSLLILFFGIYLIGFARVEGACIRLYGLVFIAIGGLSVWNAPYQIACKLEGLEIYYFIKFPRRIAWTEVTRLSIKWRRGPWGHIHMPTGSISFPLGSYFGLSSQPTFIKTIIQRANLEYKGGYAGNWLEYEKRS